MQEKFFTAKNYNYVVSMPFIKNQLVNSKNTKLIFWAPDEVDTWQTVKQHKVEIEDLCSKFDNVVEFWEGNHSHDTTKSQFIKVVNWSNFCTTLVMGKYNVLEQLEKPYTCENFLISLNRSSMPHKCTFIDILSKYDLIENNLVSWHKKNNWNYDFKHFDNEILTVDKIDINNGKEVFNYPHLYNQAAMDLVCESFDDVPDISEKTYKAIAAKKPFVSVGYKGLYKKLDELGFVKYDEVFDYTFDDLDLFEDRVEHVIKQVKNLQDKDFKKIKTLLKDKLDHNYNNLIKLSEQVPEEIFEIIDKYRQRVSYYIDVFDYIKKNRHHHNIAV